MNSPRRPPTGATRPGEAAVAAGQATERAVHSGSTAAQGAFPGPWVPASKLDVRVEKRPSCHMPSKNYMQIQARPDHSLRVPRPDLTVKIGTRAT